MAQGTLLMSPPLPLGSLPSLSTDPHSIMQGLAICLAGSWWQMASFIHFSKALTPLLSLVCTGLPDPGTGTKATARPFITQ